MSDILVKVEQLTKHFPLTKGFWESFVNRGKTKYVRAVDDVNFEIRKHDIFSLVGETGSGKSTIAKLMLKLIRPTGGKVLLEGRDIFGMNRKEEKKFRREVQMVFQDPFASLNPRRKIFDIVATSMKAQKWGSKSDRKEKVADLLNKVGLTPPEDVMERYPHEFSGGQRQRIGIARALASTPKFIVADEPVSSLDVSIQAQILNLLRDLKKEFEITFFLIAHDLAVVKHMSNTVAIMYLGRLCELASTEELFKSPLHPYTQALIATVPVPNPDFKRDENEIYIGGEMPSPINVPSGCRFNTRCPYVRKTCSKEEPKMLEVSKGHFVACHH